MSENKSEEKSQQGRSWKIMAVFPDYESARKKANELADVGMETKVKLKSVGFTVRLRERAQSPEAKPAKAGRKGKSA